MPPNKPQLDIPPSPHTILIHAIDTTASLVCSAQSFVQPPIPHHSNLNFKTMCFLLEHEDEYLLFDCGARKDFWNCPPHTKKMIGQFVPGVQVESGVDEILVNGGFDLQKLKSIIWSHWHWDHVGDASKFPPSTDLVVGPGFTENFVPGWPDNPEGFVLASDLEGHRIHEPDFPETIGGFRAHDYFGDGSFYLLDVPGHAIGHICGLARTSPTTFMFLGGDCCHFAGAFRPTSETPLPSELTNEHLDSFYPRPCPCSAFTIHHPSKDTETSRETPFYEVSRHHTSSYTHPDVAQESIEKLKHFDADPNVFVCLAHDAVLFEILPLFNHDETRDATVNDWQVRGWKEKARWDFLNDLPKGKSPGREDLVKGLWRDGRRIVLGEDLVFRDAD